MKIELKDLAQWKHVEFLMELENVGSKVFKIISKSLLADIAKDLKEKKLTKSEKYPGWSADVSPIQKDIAKTIENSINRHLTGLKWILLGGTKEEGKIAASLGLNKFTPGILFSAYLHNLDSHRQHFVDLFGIEPPEFPKSMMAETMEHIEQQFLRFTDLYLHQLKVDLVSALEKMSESKRMTALIEANKEFLDNDDAELSTKNELNTTREVKTELGKLLKNHSEKWDKMVGSNLALSSGTATHQAMIEIHGHDNSNVRVANIDMQDNRVCSWCNSISKTATGKWKLYKIENLRPSGYNFGKKRAEWQVSISPQHIACRCQTVYVPAGFKLDSMGGLEKK